MDAFPFHRTEFRRDLTAAATARRLHPVILCIEDRASSMAMRKMVLEKSGYRVVSAASGSEALAMMRAVRVDLVVSDHYLQGELGTAIAAQIKALKPNIPILIISGSIDAVAKSEHVDCVVSKADGPTDLLVSIARTLGL